MPIGSIDYVSTAAWNDPANPWPAYSRVSLSAIDSNLGAGVMQTLSLVSFDPEGLVYGYPSLRYSDKALNEGENIVLLFETNAWAVQYDGDTQYRLDGPQPRVIPAGWVQGNTTWSEDNGESAPTLSIIPVTTYLNPWEFRRRWALNG